jgi:hypothetical protein
MHSYAPAVRTRGHLNDDDPEMPFIIEYHPDRRGLSIRTGAGL